MHVRYKSLYISLQSSAKQQRAMIKFYVVRGARTTLVIFSVFPLEIKFGHYIFSLSTFPEPLLYPEQIYTVAREFLL